MFHEAVEEIPRARADSDVVVMHKADEILGNLTDKGRLAFEEGTVQR